MAKVNVFGKIMSEESTLKTGTIYIQSLSNFGGLETFSGLTG
jgi:hypothetical protein